MTPVSKLRIQIDDPALMGFPVWISKDIELKTESVVNVRLPPEVLVLAPDLSTLISSLLNRSIIIVFMID